MGPFSTKRYTLKSYNVYFMQKGLFQQLTLIFSLNSNTPAVPQTEQISRQRQFTILIS